MANSNFVVHNGLTVGPLTIDAVTGDIISSGNITVTGTINSTGQQTIGGATDATLADATSLAIALGG